MSQLGDAPWRSLTRPGCGALRCVGPMRAMPTWFPLDLQAPEPTIEPLTDELRRQLDEVRPTLRRMWDEGALSNIRKKEPPPLGPNRLRSPRHSHRTRPAPGSPRPPAPPPTEPPPPGDSSPVPVWIGHWSLVISSDLAQDTLRAGGDCGGSSATQHTPGVIPPRRGFPSRRSAPGGGGRRRRAAARSAPARSAPR